MYTVEMPHSKVRLTFGDDFSKERLSAFLDDVIQDRVDLAAVKSSPVQTLATLGIQMDPDDAKRVSAADLMDYVQFPGVSEDPSAGGVARVAAVAITLIF